MNFIVLQQLSLHSSLYVTLYLTRLPVLGCKLDTLMPKISEREQEKKKALHILEAIF